MRIPKIQFKFLRKLLRRRRRDDKAMEGASRDAGPGNRDGNGDPTQSAEARPSEVERARSATVVEVHRYQAQDQGEEEEDQYLLQPHHQRISAKSYPRAISRPKGANAQPLPSPASSTGDGDNVNNDDHTKAAGAAAEEDEAVGEKQKQKKMKKTMQSKRQSALPPPPPPAPEECPICHDPVGVRNPEGVLEGWAKLYCGHRFGTNCLRMWFQASLDRSGAHGGPPQLPSCPVCRTIARPMAPVSASPRVGMRCPLS